MRTVLDLLDPPPPDALGEPRAGINLDATGYDDLNDLLRHIVEGAVDWSRRVHEANWSAPSRGYMLGECKPETPAAQRVEFEMHCWATRELERWLRAFERCRADVPRIHIERVPSQWLATWARASQSWDPVLQSDLSRALGLQWGDPKGHLVENYTLSSSFGEHHTLVRCQDRLCGVRLAEKHLDAVWPTLSCSRSFFLDWRNFFGVATLYPDSIEGAFLDYTEREFPDPRDDLEYCGDPSGPYHGQVTRAEIAVGLPRGQPYILRSEASFVNLRPLDVRVLLDGEVCNSEAAFGKQAWRGAPYRVRGRRLEPIELPPLSSGQLGYFLTFIDRVDEPDEEPDDPDSLILSPLFSRSPGYFASDLRHLAEDARWTDEEMADRRWYLLALQRERLSRQFSLVLDEDLLSMNRCLHAPDDERIVAELRRLHVEIEHALSTPETAAPAARDISNVALKAELSRIRAAVPRKVP